MIKSVVLKLFFFSTFSIFNIQKKKTYILFGVFWLNIAKSGVYLRYKYCSKLFRKLRKKSEFRQQCCRNSTKVWERKRKSGRKKILNFGNVITEILAAQTCWPKTSRNRGKKNLWQLWQCHCRKWEEKNK